MRAYKTILLALWALLLSACVSLSGFGSTVDQTSPDAVAMAYIEAFYTGDSRSIKRILEPSELAELESDPDAKVIFIAVENIGKYVRANGGYKNLKITDIKKYDNDQSRSYFYDIDLPYVSRHSPTYWMEQYSSIDLIKDPQGLWWVKDIDGITQL